MTAAQFFLRRLKTSVLVVLASMVAAGIAWRTGTTEEILYPAVFAFAAAATLVALQLETASPGSKHSAAAEPPDPFFQRVLLVEQEQLFESRLRDLFVAHGAEVESIRPASEVWRPVDLSRGNYDVVIADAQLPYMVLAEIKSAIREQSPHQVFVVLSVPLQFPASAGARPRIIETSGPERLRKEIEGLLGN